MLKKSGHGADSIRFGVCACSRICSKEYTPAECRDNKMVEAAGIEHFAKSIKSIGYQATVPRSCLKNLKLVGELNHVYFSGSPSQ